MQIKEGYYWVKGRGPYIIAYWNAEFEMWFLDGKRYDEAAFDIGQRIPSNEEIENITYLKETIRRLEQEIFK